MRSLGWALIQYDLCPYKRKFGNRHVEREDTGSVKMAIYKPKKSKDCQQHQKVGTDKEGSSP